jgi:hypothetical protein
MDTEIRPEIIFDTDLPGEDVVYKPVEFVSLCAAYKISCYEHLLMKGN